MTHDLLPARVAGFSHRPHIRLLCNKKDTAAVAVSSPSYVPSPYSTRKAASIETASACKAQSPLKILLDFILIYTV